MAYMDLIIKHRLKFFILSLLVIGFVIIKLMPSFIFKSVLTANEGIGYSAVVSALSKAGTYIESETEPGSLDRAQGYRYALRRIEQWNGVFMSDHNALTPTISRCPSRLCKYGFDNPDAVYQTVGPVSSKYQYRVFGQKGNVSYLTYQLFNIGPDGFGTSDTMESDALVYDDNGGYEIFLGAENLDNHPNFLQLPEQGGAGQLVIRSLIKDWNNEIEPTLNVEVLGLDKGVPATSTPLNMKMFDPRAFGLGRIIENNIKAWREKIMNAPANSMPMPTAAKSGGSGGFITNHTAVMRFEVEPDEAVLIEVQKADVVYSNIQLSNMWGESLDYGSHLVSFNDAQAYLDADNVFRYVIAHKDPGVPNWLDTVGHSMGGVFVRFQSPKEELTQPAAKLVSFSDLKQYLPPDHPTVTPAQRAQTIRARLSGLNRKKNPVYNRDIK